MGPAVMLTLAVGASWFVCVASLPCGAWVVMSASVISSGMWPGAAAASCLPSTPCCPVAPVLALEALGGSWDVEAYGTYDSFNDNTVHYCSIGSSFGLVADH